MQYSTLSGSAIKVSKLCLGSMTWGEQNTAAQAHAQLDCAIDHGINFIDTAELYPSPVRAATYGTTEQILGSWRNLERHRQHLVIASKVVGPAPKKWIGHIRGGPQLNAAQVEQALHATLKRLGTDYLDLYQIHWPARHTNYFGQLGYCAGQDKHNTTIEETLEALNQLVTRGLVRALGVSNETPWGLHRYLRAAEMHQWKRITTIQNPYNLLNRVYEIGLAEFADRSGVDLLAYSPLGCGLLTGKYFRPPSAGHSLCKSDEAADIAYNPAPAQARLNRHRNYFYRYTIPAAIQAARQYQCLADEFNLDLTHLALAFVSRKPFVKSTIIGATSIAQLQHNLQCTEITLDAELLTRIEKIHMAHPSPCA